MTDYYYYIVIDKHCVFTMSLCVISVIFTTSIVRLSKFTPYTSTHGLVSTL